MIRISSLLERFQPARYPSVPKRTGWLALHQPSFRRAGMRLESFRAAEPDRVLDKRTRRGAVVDAKPGPHAQEGVDRQAAGRARRSAGREDVIRPRAVVAQDFRGSRADEQRAVMG